MDGYLEELAEEDCLRLLRCFTVGRVGVVVDDFPVVVPVNYRFVDDGDGFGLVVRTRTASVIDRGRQVAFEVDGVDPVHEHGWSVVVRGLIEHLDEAAVAELGPEIDPRSWVADRDSWVIIRPCSVTGRRLHPPEIEWVFGAVGYL